MNKLTLEQIGKLAGVSSSTVSRVINNHPHVRPSVREKVLQVVSETGYRPNPAARRLAGQRSRIMGLVIPETPQILFTDPYFPRLIQGIAQSCQQYDYTLSLFIFHAIEDEVKLTPRVLRTQLMDGLILTSTQIGDPLVEQLLESELPFVMVGRHDAADVSFVDADNRAGAYAAVSHLVRMGRRRVATITGPMNNVAAVDRKEGYLQALQDRGRSIDPDLIIEADYTEAGGFLAMRQLLDYAPDAVFAASDSMALGALRALRQEDIEVPEQVAVVGYDDLPQAGLAIPPLTTVRQPIKRAGTMAVELLVDILEHGRDPARRVTLPTELVLRASCGAALENHARRR